MAASVLMLQGTGSDVGKSMLTTALCRIASRRGIRVAPFKPQNMSNNAAACQSGGEIGRAQALQALACGLEPHTDMSPVLLKPQTDRVAQVIVQGRVFDVADASSYMARRHRLLGAVLESFDRLATNYDLILVEGAGSPAETNLRAGDIANMGFARRRRVPVCLIGDIDKGGVIASLVGTHAVLDAADRDLVVGFLINKFRGDPSLFDAGVAEIERRCGWPCFGIAPWIHSAARLPAEDAVTLDQPAARNRGALKVAAPMLSRLANFDDADPLRLEPGLDFQWIPPGRPIPRDANVIILFGTKSTRGDLAFLREHGWDHDIIAHARAGGTVLGICGGYQILGRTVSDPQGIDGEPGTSAGLGLLQVDTVMRNSKQVSQFSGVCAHSGATLGGYEIHAGETTGPDTERPMVRSGDTPNGARSHDGRVEGFYVHGAFASDPYRREWLARVGAAADGALDYAATISRALDELADHVEASIDVDALLACAWPPETRGD